MKTILISEQPWAQWLADSLGELEARSVKSLALLGVDASTGEVVTGYFNCNMADKAAMAANVQADALFDSVLANADLIVQRAQEMDEEDEEIE
mgnify:CR=1 FL=1